MASTAAHDGATAPQGLSAANRTTIRLKMLRDLERAHADLARVIVAVRWQDGAAFEEAVKAFRAHAKRADAHLTTLRSPVAFHGAEPSQTAH